MANGRFRIGFPLRLWLTGVLAAAGCALVCGAEQAKPGVETVLPADALLALVIPDLSAARAQFSQTRLGEMFAQPAVQEFMQPVLAEIKKQYAAVRERQNWLPSPEDLDNVLLSGGLAIALAPPKNVEENTTRAILILTPKDPAAFLKLIPQEFAAKLQTGQPVAEGHLAWVGGRLVFSTSAAGLQELTARLQKPAAEPGALADSAGYKAARAHLTNSAIWLYDKPAQLLDTGLNFVKMEFPAYLNVATKVKAVCLALGVDKLETEALGAGTRGGEVVLEGWAGLNAPPHEDLFSLSFPQTAQPISPEAFKIAPPGAPYVMARYFNFAGVMPLLQRVLQAAEPELAQSFTAQLQQINQTVLHFDLQKDFLENLGGEVVVVQPSLETGLAGLPNLVYSFQAKDAAKLEDCLNKAAAALENLPEPLKGKIKLKKLAYQGRSICYVSGPVFQLSPAVCVTDGRVLCGVSITGLRQVLDQISKPENILANKSFQDSLARATGKPFDAQNLPSVFAYSQDQGNGDGALVTASAYLAAAGGITAGLAYMPNPAEGAEAPNPAMAEKVALAVLREADVALWPDEGFFRSYRQPTVAFAMFEKNGIYARTELPPPMPGVPKMQFASMTSVAVVAVAAGLILPVLARARESARRTQSAYNLMQMGKAAFMFADIPANNNLFPTDAAQLYPAFVAEWRIFRNPRCPEVEAPYTWVSGLANDMPTAIVAFENDHTDITGGRNVLMGGGSVEWILENEFHKRLAETEQFIKAAGREMQLVPINWKNFQAQAPQQPPQRLRRRPAPAPVPAPAPPPAEKPADQF